jgi:uncharacterized repeat protein (TIGR01451 family)
MVGSDKHISRSQWWILFLACVVGLTLAFSGRALGTITFDRASSRTGTAASLSWSHTVGTGANRILLVGVSIRTATRTVSSITYAGVNLTRLGFRNSAGNRVRMEMWYLLSPPQATANVIVTLSASAAVVGGAVSFFGVDPTVPFGTFTSATATSATASTSVTSAPDEIVVDVAVAQGNAFTLTAGGGQTAHWNTATGIAAGDACGASSRENGASSVTMSWTLLLSRAWAIGAVPLKPAPDPNIVLTLSQSISAPPPGNTVTYTMDFQNTGVGPAASTSITLPVPPNTAYVPNSVMINGVPKTDAADADEVTLAGSTVTVNLGSVPAGVSGTVTYRVVIQ